MFSQRVNARWVSGGVYLLLAVTVFFLGVNFSKDWIWYQRVNDYQILVYEKRGLGEYFGLLREPIYLLSSVHVSRFIGFFWFVFLTTVSLLYLKLRSLEKILGNPYAGTFFYICTYLLLFDGTAIRTGFATAFIMCALLFLKNAQYYRAIALMFVAGFIHLSSWVFLLIFFLYFYRKSWLAVAFFSILAATTALLEVDVFELARELLAMINPRYLEYGSAEKVVGQNSTGLYFYFIAFYTLLLIFVWKYLKLRIAEDQFARSIYLLAVLSIPTMIIFHNHVALGGRLGELLLLPVVVLLPWLDGFFKEKRMILHRSLLYATFTAFFAARFVYLFPTALTMLRPF